MLVRIASTHRSTNAGSLAVPRKSDEQRYTTNGRSDRKPTREQKLSRLRDGGAPEPLVVAVRAGDHDALRRHAMHLDRFALLDLVPDDDGVWAGCG